MGYRVDSHDTPSYRIYLRPIYVEDVFHEVRTINACKNIGMECLNDFSMLTERELRGKPRFGGKGKTVDEVKEAMNIYGIRFRDE